MNNIIQASEYTKLWYNDIVLNDLINSINGQLNTIFASGRSASGSLVNIPTQYLDIVCKILKDAGYNVTAKYCHNKFEQHGMYTVCVELNFVKENL